MIISSAKNQHNFSNFDPNRQGRSSEFGILNLVIAIFILALWFMLKWAINEQSVDWFIPNCILISSRRCLTAHEYWNVSSLLSTYGWSIGIRVIYSSWDHFNNDSRSCEALFPQGHQGTLWQNESFSKHSQNNLKTSRGTVKLKRSYDSPRDFPIPMILVTRCGI